MSGKSAVWAPDSAHFATSIGGENVYDVQGSLVRQCEFSSPRWLDATHLLGIGVDQKPPYRAFICDIQDGTTTTIDLPELPDEVLANGHGAVAIAWPTDNAWRNPHYDFVVWSGGVSTKPHDGLPESWSADGTELAVLHQSSRDGTRGWVSMASWPGLDPLYVGPRGWDGGHSYFDPSGRYVAFETFDDTGQIVTRVVDLTTGGSVDVPGRNDHDIEWWTADERLSVIVGGHLTDTYSTDGELATNSISPGAYAFASADGSTVVYADSDSTTGTWLPTVVAVRNGHATAFQLPAVGLESSFAVSPDGLAIVVAGADSDHVTYLLTGY